MADKPGKARSFARKVVRVMWIVPVVILAVILVAAGVLWAYSPGKPTPFLDENGSPLAGSISEKVRVPVNGVEQGMFIRGKDVHNPVLLFVHGGPGMPEYFLNRISPTGLEDDFTVVWWEQRGVGLSYGAPPETMTVEQMVEDVIGVTNYLRDRFGVDKVYLMAHSWGSFIGIQAAQRAPELYYAYIGMGQVSRQLASEREAWQYMVDQYTAAGNTRMLRKLEEFPMPELDAVPAAYRGLRDATMHDLGIGTTHTMRSVELGIFVPVWLERDYILLEKLNIWRGKWSAPSSALWNEMIATDLASLVTRLEIPVYIFQGRYDLTCSYNLAREYFEELQAPVKGFYTFEQSAHSPLFEEPAKARSILLGDVLEGK